MRTITNMVFIILLFSACNAESGSQAAVEKRDSEKKSDSITNIPLNAEKLIKAYPNHVLRYENNTIVWYDSSSTEWNDGKEKNARQLLDLPDTEDMFAYEYPLNFSLPPEYMQDPGRIRFEPFFKKIYGSDKKQVEANLEKVAWLPATLSLQLKFSKINGAADSLRAVSAAIDSLPYLHKYVSKPAGTYYWRFISGTDRLSAHSFAIAIDINIEYFNYWKWDEQKGQALEYKNRVPVELVQIFERHGFIWGGKWHHYDTGHFEFRPEFFVK